MYQAIGMKLYHVETQEDYDALMKELDEKGYYWSNYNGLFDTNEWIFYKSETVVNTDDNKKELSYSNKEFFQSRYPNEEIITYNAKTEKEKLGLPEWAKWLARDEGGCLYAYDVSPHGKSDGIWVMKYDSTWQRVRETDDTFSHIEWTDEEPTRVKQEETTMDQDRITAANAHGYDEVPEIETNDLVNHPNHYKQGGLETIDIMQALLPHEQFIGYLKGNIIKYRERAEHKGNAEQDYAKAKWYYDKLIEHTEG